MPAVAIAPRTMSATTVASNMPRKRMSIATNTLGIYEISSFKISVIEVRPRASNAGTRKIRMINQNTIRPRKSAGSKRMPIRCSKRVSPIRLEKLSNPILRNRKVTALPRAFATSQPTSRMTRKPINFGMNAKTSASAVVNEVRIA